MNSFCDLVPKLAADEKARACAHMVERARLALEGLEHLDDAYPELVLKPSLEGDLIALSTILNNLSDDINCACGTDIDLAQVTGSSAARYGIAQAVLKDSIAPDHPRYGWDRKKK